VYQIQYHYITITIIISEYDHHYLWIQLLHLQLLNCI